MEKDQGGLPSLIGDLEPRFKETLMRVRIVAAIDQILREADPLLSALHAFKARFADRGSTKRLKHLDESRDNRMRKRVCVRVPTAQKRRKLILNASLCRAHEVTSNQILNKVVHFSEILFLVRSHCVAGIVLKADMDGELRKLHSGKDTLHTRTQ